MRHTRLILLTLCLILLQPIYGGDRLLSIRGMALLGGGTLYASSILLVCYHLLRADPPDAQDS